jgi:hypothetical protein
MAFSSLPGFWGPTVHCPSSETDIGQDMPAPEVLSVDSAERKKIPPPGTRPHGEKANHE